MIRLEYKNELSRLKDLRNNKEHNKCIKGCFELIEEIGVTNGCDIKANILWECYRLISMVFSDLVDYSKSLEFAGKMFDYTNTNRERGLTYQRQGIVYRRMGQLDKCVECYDRAEQYYIMDDNKLDLAGLLNNKAVVTKDITYAERAIHIYKTINDEDCKRLKIEGYDKYVYIKNVKDTMNKIKNNKRFGFTHYK